MLDTTDSDRQPGIELQSVIANSPGSSCTEEYYR
jgi:hypothetical protein